MLSGNTAIGSGAARRQFDDVVLHCNLFISKGIVADNRRSSRVGGIPGTQFAWVTL